MDIFRKCLCITITNLLAAMPCAAGIAVIVHPKNNETFTPSMVRSIFLGKVKVFHNGLPIFVIGMGPGNAARNEFHTRILHKSDSELEAYWQHSLYFSPGSQPEELKDSSSVVKLVAENQFAIGYVDINAVDDSVKVLDILQ